VNFNDKLILFLKPIELYSHVIQYLIDDFSLYTNKLKEIGGFGFVNLYFNDEI
jgi:hypothetical protein